MNAPSWCCCDDDVKRKKEVKEEEKNVSKFHHLYSFKNELKYLRFLLTNYVNIVWQFFFLFSLSLSPFLDVFNLTWLHSTIHRLHYSWNMKNYKIKRVFKSEMNVKRGKKKTWWTKNDNRHSNETHPWKSQNGKRVKWIFHERRRREKAKEMQESWFWHDFRDFWIFLLFRSSRSHHKSRSWNHFNIEIENAQCIVSTSTLQIQFSCVFCFNSKKNRHIKRDEIKLNGQKKNKILWIDDKRKPKIETRFRVQISRRNSEREWEKNETEAKRDKKKFVYLKILFHIKINIKWKLKNGWRNFKKKEKQVEVNCKSHQVGIDKLPPQFPWCWFETKSFEMLLPNSNWYQKCNESKKNGLSSINLMRGACKDYRR